MLEQNMFNLTTLSFDDNKILKCQLELLIFVQDHSQKFISQELVLKEQKRANESTKEACCKTESED